jgi:DNA processing protein
MSVSSLLSKLTSVSTNSTHLVDILRLIRSENVGIKTFQSLIKIYGTAAKALEMLPELSKRGGRSVPIKPYSKSQVEDEIAATKKLGGKVLCYLDDEYPNLLKHIDDYPPVISIQGNAELLNKPAIGIVGARNSSLNGKIFAGKIAETLGANSIIISSGLARGIDTAAHKASLKTGTIAVIAGGLGHIYPPENADLYREIAEKGVIVAELATGSVPRSQHFPQRNRIISGISLGIVVIEAGLQSGSLITARLALEQNREIFAVPGFPLDPRCIGTNKLIKEGAILVDSPETIIDNLPNLERILESKISDNEDSCYNNFSINLDHSDLEFVRKKVLELLSATPISLDQLCSEVGFPVQYITLALIELELSGKLIRSPGSNFTIVLTNS